MLPSIRIVDAIRSGGSVAQIARSAGIPKRSLQSIVDGAVPSVDRAAVICDALGLELYIGPPRNNLRARVAPDIRGQAPNGMTTVRDRELAEMIAVLADAWEAAELMERGHLLGRFDLAFREERERRRPSRRVLAWLGWQVVENNNNDGGGKARAAGE